MAERFRIAVVAPASQGLKPEALTRTRALAAARWGDRVEIVAHEQAFHRDGHFAGSDQVREDAFVAAANDPAVDAVWFGRGGYGACRMAEAALARLGPAARDKAYLGYSDVGALLSGLYRHGIGRPAHGPLMQDVLREEEGEACAMRALSWLVEGDPGALEPTVGTEGPALALNLSVLASILGTPLEPPMAGHVLMIEDLCEPMYRIDRMLFQVTSTASVRTVKGLRLGRLHDVTPNDPEFGVEWRPLVERWCAKAAIPFLGEADIGHDAANRVVPFG